MPQRQHHKCASICKCMKYAQHSKKTRNLPFYQYILSRSFFLTAFFMTVPRHPVFCLYKHMISLSPHKLILSALIASTIFHAPAFSADTSQVVASGQQEVIPVADFFRMPSLTKAQLSPDGKRIAMLAEGAAKRHVLAVMDVSDLKPRILAQFTNVDISSFHWVNSQRLVYSVSNYQLDKDESNRGPGLWAIDADGSNQRQLILRGWKESGSMQRVLEWNHRFVSSAGDAYPDDIFVYKVQYHNDSSRAPTNDLLRLNTRTGTQVLIPRPGEALGWLLDQNKFPRLVSVSENGRSVTYLLNTDGSKKKLFDEALFQDDGLRAEFFDQHGKLYVSKLKNHDLRELYSFDTETLQTSVEPVIAFDGYDYNGDVLISRKDGEWLGLQYETDAPGALWFNPELKKIQETIDQLLPGKSNLLSPSRDLDVILIYSGADNDPGSFHIYHPASKKITTVGQLQPWIDPARMAYRDPVRITTRDGLSLPAYLTLPRGQKKQLPMVVLIHGGPNLRGEYWHWDPQARFLASRGYAVLQVDFRGSKGYGQKHESLGWKQWGLTMQDDITDATRWAIQQGIADPQRICLAGASYGGYATLMGLIKEPELYRCGIAWAAVTDIDLRYSVTWSDSNDYVEKFFLPLKVGDRIKDAAQFKATSPLQNAARLRQPLLYAHGAEDLRVPMIHGTKFRDAVTQHNQQVEWVSYPNEGHGWQRLENNIDFWTRVEKFLKNHIQKP